MNINVAIELIKLTLGQITIFDLSEEARASAKPTNYKDKEVNLHDGTTFYFPYDEAVNVIINTIENEYNKALEDFTNLLIDNLEDFGEGQNVIMAIDRGRILKLKKQLVK